MKTQNLEFMKSINAATQRRRFAFLWLALLPCSSMGLVIRHDTPTLSYENHGKLSKFNASVSIVRGDNKEYGIAGGTAIDSRWLVHARHTYKSVFDYMASGKTAVARGSLWSKWNNTGTSTRSVQTVIFFDDDFSRFANAIDIGLAKLGGFSSTLRIAPLYSSWDEVGRVGMGASAANNRLDGNGVSRKPENESTSNSGRPYEVRWAGNNDVDKVETQSLGSPNNALLKMDFDHPTNTGKSIMGGNKAIDLEHGTMNGDSGSPVYIDRNGVDGLVAGVLSGGSGNDYGSSLIYVRINPYRTWITDTIIDNPDTRTLSLATIANITVGVGATAKVTAKATASDAPPLTITYSLVSPPAGATINASTGSFAWTPGEADAGTTKTITVKVADNGIPVKSVTKAFTVTIQAGADEDEDGMGDAWENTHFTNTSRDGTGDFDLDGLTDAQEYSLGTLPKVADSDGDTHADGWEFERGFNPAVSTPIFKWTAGGDGLSVFQESNWTRAGGSTVITTINPATPVTVDLLSESGSPGGGGFSNILDMGSKRLGIHGGTFSSQTTSGIKGSAGSKITLGAGTLNVGYLDAIPTEIFGKPSLTFRQAVNPLRNGAVLRIMTGASPRIAVTGATVAYVISNVFPQIQIENDPAVNGENVMVIMRTPAEVIVYRMGDTDGDSASDEWEWSNGFSAISNIDGFADTDGDGKANWLESRLGTDPRVQTAGLFLRIIEAGTGTDHSGGGPGGEDGGDPRTGFGDVILHFGPGGSGLLYQILTAPDPAGPWTLLEQVDSSGIAPGGTAEIYHSDAPSTRAFYRMEVNPDGP